MKIGDMTGFKDSNGTPIKIGDELHILATNQYNGTVSHRNGCIRLDTVFFNHPLVDHLTALDLQTVFVYDNTQYNGDLFEI